MAANRSAIRATPDQSILFHWLSSVAQHFRLIKLNIRRCVHVLVLYKWDEHWNSFEILHSCTSVVAFRFISLIILYAQILMDCDPPLHFIWTCAYIAECTASYRRHTHSFHYAPSWNISVEWNTIHVLLVRMSIAWNLWFGAHSI